MAQIASEALVERLADWGVDTVFGLPGDGINGILEAFRRHQDRIKFVLVHHEEAAAFMATAHAKATGQLGVCLATSGPGGIHLLNGLYDAKLDHMPVLAITGMQETSVLGTGYQQEVHLDRLYEDVAVYDQMIYNPAQLPALVDIAVRTAYARRGVAHLTVPTDIQVAKAGENPYEEVGPARPPATAPIRLTAPGRPSAEDLQRLADVLNASTKPAILAGAGALHAREELLAVAEVLGAPIIKTLSGKATVPDDSPYTTGGIGLLGTAPSEELMNDLDTLFMVGTNFPYTHFMPEPGKARIVQIEADPARAGRPGAHRGAGGRRRQGGPGRAAAAAQAAVRHQVPGEVPEADGVAGGRRWPRCRTRSATRSPRSMSSRVLDELAADDAILTCDSGTIATWAARHWHIRGDRRVLPVRQPGHDGPRAALRGRHPARVPRPPGDRLRR